MKQVVKLRDKDQKPWHEIAGETGESAGKCMLAHEMAHLPSGEKVTYKNETELAKKVVKLRDSDALSWGSIVARTDVPESRLRSLYESVKGEGSTKGNRIGKGGRHPGDGVGTTKAPKASKRAPAKKTAAKKAPAAKKAAPVKKAAGKRVAKKASGTTKGGGAGSHALLTMTLPELKTRLEGSRITVKGSDDKERIFKVKTVRGAENGNLEFTEATTGNARTVLITNVVRATKV
jgi:hypothetical protein